MPADAHDAGEQDVGEDWQCWCFGPVIATVRSIKRLPALRAAVAMGRATVNPDTASGLKETRPVA